MIVMQYKIWEPIYMGETQGRHSSIALHEWKIKFL